MGLTISVEVSNGTEANVELDSVADGRKVVSISPGDRSMVLNEVTSPVMNGSVITSAVTERQTANIVVRCFGTPSEVLSALDDLEVLFSQLVYTVTVDVSGKSETWVCGPANAVRGQQGTYDGPQLAGGWQDIVFEIPRQPANY